MYLLFVYLLFNFSSMDRLFGCDSTKSQEGTCFQSSGMSHKVSKVSHTPSGLRAEVSFSIQTSSDVVSSVAKAFCCKSTKAEIKINFFMVKRVIYFLISLIFLL